MSRTTRFVTHVYSLEGAWSRTKRERLTVDSAQRLRAAGYTMVRVRRCWSSPREIALAAFLERHRTSSRRTGRRS